MMPSIYLQYSEEEMSMLSVVSPLLTVQLSCFLVYFTVCQEACKVKNHFFMKDEKKKANFLQISI
jgi:hypothetical protein